MQVKKKSGPWKLLRIDVFTKVPNQDHISVPDHDSTVPLIS